MIVHFLVFVLIQKRKEKERYIVHCLAMEVDDLYGTLSLGLMNKDWN